MKGLYDNVHVEIFKMQGACISLLRTEGACVHVLEVYVLKDIRSKCAHLFYFFYFYFGNARGEIVCFHSRSIRHSLTER